MIHLHTTCISYLFQTNSSCFTENADNNCNFRVQWYCNCNFVSGGWTKCGLMTQSIDSSKKIGTVCICLQRIGQLSFHTPPNVEHIANMPLFATHCVRVGAKLRFPNKILKLERNYSCISPVRISKGSVPFQTIRSLLACFSPHGSERKQRV